MEGFSWNSLALNQISAWLGFTVLTMILLANVPACLRGGARQNDPSLTAALFGTFLALFCFGASFYTSDPRDFLITDRDLLLSFLLVGSVTAFFWLCLFTALSGAQASRVFPIERISAIVLILMGYFQSNTLPSLWSMCGIVLFLLGTVLILSRGNRLFSGRWSIYAVMALILSVILSCIKPRIAPTGLDSTVQIGGRALVASVLLWFFALVRKKHRTFSKMRVESWVFLILAAFLFALSLITTRFADRAGDYPALAPVSVLGYGLMILATRIVNRDTLPGSSLFGTLLAMAGLFVLEMGW